MLRWCLILRSLTQRVGRNPPTQPQKRVPHISILRCGHRAKHDRSLFPDHYPPGIALFTHALPTTFILRGANMWTRTKIGLVILLAASIYQYRATAQDVHDENCAPDPELIAVPPCAIQHIGGQTRIIQSHLTTRSLNKYGLAPAWIEGGWTYVDRRGLVVVENVAIMDNWANEFHHGLVRVTHNDKWGLADTHGKQVVPCNTTARSITNPA